VRWFAFGAIAFLLAGADAVAVVQERDDDRDQFGLGEVVEHWRLADVGADGRTLKLF
jgi:hypothetical protein